MPQWIRRMRGIVGVGLTWAAAWFGAGLALLLVVGLHAADVPFPLFFGLLGFLAGATFAGLLGTLGRRRSFRQLSLSHVAGWGALGGLLVATVVNWIAGPGEWIVIGPVFATAGAISAGGTLAIARRGEARDLLDGAATAIDAADRGEESDRRNLR